MAVDETFFNLTPERVLDAVEAGGVGCRALCYPLNSFENRVYEVELDSGARVVAKFYRPGRWSAAQILEEHAFLADLEEAEVPVCPVRRFPDGTTLREVDGIHYCLADRRGGRAPDELGDQEVVRLGRLVARLHTVGAADRAGERPRLSADHYVRRSLDWLRRQGTLPDRVAARYLSAAETLAALADARMEGTEAIRVHGDLHLGNVLLRDEQFHLLDFDDMVTGPPVQDLWLLVPGRGPEAERRRELFLAGYEEFRRFDRTTLGLIEPLRGMRLVRYAVWLARRWDDPAFRAGWPQFADPDFWDRETTDLESLVEVIEREEPRALGEGASVPLVGADVEAKELTNSDYFWDWED